jgi:hypothetical protein
MICSSLRFSFRFLSVLAGFMFYSSPVSFANDFPKVFPAKLSCAFTIAGAPFATTTLTFTSESTIADGATIEHYGAVQQATVTVKTPASGEWLSVAFDEGIADRELFQTVSAKPVDGADGVAGVLTNPASPFMKNLPGTCVWKH